MSIKYLRRIKKHKGKENKESIKQINDLLIVFNKKFIDYDSSKNKNK